MREVILVGASWCGACKAMKTWFDELRQRSSDPYNIPSVGLRYVDVESFEVADEGISSLPVILFRENGQTLQSINQAIGLPELLRQIRSVWPDTAI